jgi:hypothetical protein
MLTPDELRREALKSLRSLRKIREKVNKKFGGIRNTAMAHRDPNALVQYRAIRALNVQDVWDIAAEFFAAVETFMAVLTQLLEAGNTLQSHIRQWSMSRQGKNGLEKGYSPVSAPPAPSLPG